MITPFFTRAGVHDFRSAITADTRAFAVFFQAMLEGGVYLPPSQFESWFISGAHTVRDIDTTLEVARRAMRAVAVKAG
jgi:glutamate-1-semialdehyde 2,1-aminomutase